MKHTHRSTRARRQMHTITRLTHHFLVPMLVVVLAAFSLLSFGAAFSATEGRADIATALGNILKTTNVQNIPIGNGRSVSMQGGQVAIDLHEDQPSGGIADRPGCQSTNCITTISGTQYSGIATTTSIRSAVQNWINFFLGFLGLIAVAMLVYAGFRYITSAGEDVDAAKNTIIYVVVGIFVIFLAYSIVNTVITFGPKGGDLESNIIQSQALNELPPTYEEYASHLD